MIRFLQTEGPIKKFVLGGILVLSIIGMTVYLIPTGSGSFIDDLTGNVSQGVLAKVGDQEISTADVQRSAQQLGRQQFPKGYPEGIMPLLMQQAANNLITQKAMLVEASRMGFQVTEDELRQQLQQGGFGQALFPGGQFIGEDRYEDFVQQQFNMSVPQFEDALKSDLLIGKLRAAVEGGVTVSDSDIQKEYLRENTKVKFEYAVITADDVMKQIHPSDAELKAFWDKNKQNYANSVPEKRTARYVVIDANKVKEQTQVTPQELQSYYSQHLDEYRVPDQVNLSMILIKADPSDKKAMDAAHAKADDLLKQLKAGANFADLAKKNSQDPDSASKGGSLGWIQRGRIPIPEVEQAAFSLPKGEISPVIQSPLGFQIIKVDDKQSAHLKPLEEVKSEIEPVIAGQKASQKADTLARTVASQARTAGLEKAIKDNGLELVNAGPFTRTDSLPGIGTAPDVMNALFTARADAAPDTVETPQGSVIYQVTNITPAATPTFDQIKDKVTEDYKNQQVGTLLLQRTQELTEKARSEHDLKKAAKETGASLKTSDLVGPDSQVPDLGSMSGPGPSAAFDMKPGEIQGPISAGRNGAVIQLLDKQEPPLDQLAASRDRIREMLLEQKRNEFLEVFAANLREQMQKDGRIRINKQEMEQITKPTSSSGY